MALHVHTLIIATVYANDRLSHSWALGLMYVYTHSNNTILYSIHHECITSD